MTPASLSHSITDFVFSLLKTEVAMDVCGHLTRSSGGSALISWDAEPKESEFPYDQFGTLEEYFYFLQNRQFSAVLNDGAILQMSYKMKHKHVVWHRLSYHPCPLAFTFKELEGIPLVDYIENLTATSLRSRLRNRSAIRFDYDPSEAKPNHPASHMTLNESCCRIAVKSSMSPRSFVAFIFSNFYPSLWASVPALHALPDGLAKATITADEIKAYHLHRLA